MAGQQGAWNNFRQQTAPLPPGWEARYDQGQARYYFINHSTHETSWNDPRLSGWQQPYVQQPTVTPSPRQPEHIQLKDMTARTRTHSGPSSSNQQAETSISNLVDEDDEWHNALLQTALNESNKEPSFMEKLDMKDKLKTEFNDLDDFQVDNALDTCKYDENMAKAILQSLRDSLQEKKVRERKAEEVKRMKKEREEKRKAEKEIKEMERLLKERAEAEAAQQRMLRDNSGSPTSSKNLMTSRPSTAVKTVTKTRAAQKTTSSKAATRGKNPEKAKSKSNKNSAERSSPYVSTNRIPVTGSQSSLRKGPDASHLLPRFVTASGPNKALSVGPCQSNCKGPSQSQPRISLSQGPQRCLREGPQHNLLSKGTLLTTAI